MKVPPSLRSFHPQSPNSTTNHIIRIQTRARALNIAAWSFGISQDTLVRPGNRLSFCLSEACGALVRGVCRVEAVDDGMNHDGLLGDGEGAVRGNCDPVVWSSVSGCCVVRVGTYLFRM